MLRFNGGFFLCFHDDSNNFNTSYVTVQLKRTDYLVVEILNFNTSYVTVQRKMVVKLHEG